MGENPEFPKYFVKVWGVYNVIMYWDHGWKPTEFIKYLKPK